MHFNLSIYLNQWFSNCVPRHFGVPSEIRRVPQNFFRQDEILQFFYRNLLGCAAKNFWSLLGCREPQSLKTTDLNSSKSYRLNRVDQKIYTLKLNEKHTRNKKCTECTLGRIESARIETPVVLNGHLVLLEYVL